MDGSVKAQAIELSQKPQTSLSQLHLSPHAPHVFMHGLSATTWTYLQASMLMVWYALLQGAY
jgi:hypothetical protein